MLKGLPISEAANWVGISPGAWMDAEDGSEIPFAQLSKVINYCWPDISGHWVAIPGLPKELTTLQGPDYRTATVELIKAKHVSVDYLAEATGMNAGRVEFLLAQTNCKDEGIKELYHAAKNAPDPAHL